MRTIAFVYISNFLYPRFYCKFLFKFHTLYIYIYIKPKSGTNSSQAVGDSLDEIEDDDHQGWVWKDDYGWVKEDRGDDDHDDKWWLEADEPTASWLAFLGCADGQSGAGDREYDPKDWDWKDDYGWVKKDPENQAADDNHDSKEPIQEQQAATDQGLDFKSWVKEFDSDQEDEGDGGQPLMAEGCEEGEGDGGQIAGLEGSEDNHNAAGCGWQAWEADFINREIASDGEEQQKLDDWGENAKEEQDASSGDTKAEGFDDKASSSGHAEAWDGAKDDEWAKDETDWQVYDPEAWASDWYDEQWGEEDASAKALLREMDGLQRTFERAKDVAIKLGREADEKACQAATRHEGC
ncbi:unnamed protein product [Symbiodinium microadriaticum]|nr:unnamed protein product [Symbiodinium microadriaticum]